MTKNYTVYIVFGQEQVRKESEGNLLNPDELNSYCKEFSFSSEKEMDAFIKGAEIAVGWQEIYVIPENEFNSKYLNLSC